MRALRVVVLALFALSVAITLWSVLASGSETHNAHGSVGAGIAMLTHVLHVAHVVLIVLTFLLIALYLLKSADIASLTLYRELKLRMTVDPDAGLIEFIPTGAPIFNACAGALAKKGIYVRSMAALTTLAKLKTVYAEGNSNSREGYDITVATLDLMGIKLSDNADSCPLRLLLGPFDPKKSTEYDFVLSNNKVTHILAAVFFSRVFARFSVISLIVLSCAIIAAVVLSVFMQFTFAAAAIALWSASEVLIIHRIARRTARLSFKTVSSL